jgi:hypothetical protein
MKQLLRTQAPDRDADLIVVTDEDVTLDERITPDELRMVVAVLARKVQAFYLSAADRPCRHRLDEMGGA